MDSKVAEKGKERCCAYIYIIYVFSYLYRKDCCGVYIMDENRLNKPYNSVFTHVLQYNVPHPYFQFFAR